MPRSLEKRLATGLENGLGNALPDGDGFRAEETGGQGQPKRKTPLLRLVRPADAMTGWDLRDDFLRTCISMGLNARQIHLLSLSSPHPLNSTQRVYQKITEQGLERLYKSRPIERRRRGYHNEQIIRVAMKLIGQALEYGYEVSEVMRDEVPTPGVKFRPDIGLTIGGQQFYVEVQLSRIEFTRWHAKLKQYLKLYRLQKRPFRALILLADDNAVTRVREYARDILHRNPNLVLYHFLSLGEFERAPDVIKSKVWYYAWNTKRRWFLR